MEQTAIAGEHPLTQATRGRGYKLIESFRANERDRVSYYGPAVPMQLARALKRAPLAVIVNQRTASGAEILAAALQGNGRAQLVGARTLGRGSVQTLFPLTGGAALKVTTAYWHAPRDVRRVICVESTDHPYFIFKNSNCLGIARSPRHGRGHADL